MVALGLKSDYMKDCVVHLAAVVWLIVNSSVLLINTGKIAGLIDQPIRCGVPASGNLTGNFTDNLTGREVQIRAHCEEVGGEFFIPSDAWTGERTWFDFFLVNAWTSFVLGSIFFTCSSAYQYHKLYTAEGDEAELQRHEIQTKLSQIRSAYMLTVTSLSISFFLLFAVILSKLTAYGAWIPVGARAVVQAKGTLAGDVLQDQDSWDLEVSFYPDFSDLFSFEEPDASAENYLGHYLHNFVVYLVMAFLKNAFVVVIDLVTDDWHVVSLAFAAIPAAVAVALFYVPYMASFYLFYQLVLHFYIDFDFEFGHEIKTCVFGGIVFGSAALPQVFSACVVQPLSKAGRLFDIYLKMLKSRGEEPSFAAVPYMKILLDCLADTANQAVVIATVFGCIGLPCLGYSASVVDHPGIFETFNVILGFWLVLWGIVACIACWNCTCRARTESLRCLSRDIRIVDLKEKFYEQQVSKEFRNKLPFEQTVKHFELEERAASGNS